MIYLQRDPNLALAPFIKTFWYARDPHATHSHQRVLPAGRRAAGTFPYLIRT
jgi:hypothetical protein